MQSRGVALVLIALGTAGFIACGSRTELPFDESAEEAADTSPDVRRLPDGAIDDSPEEPLPMLDASKRDANRMDCLDAGETQIYVITTDTNELLSFYPPAGTFKSIGVIACPIPPPDPKTGMLSAPFSMAVDRKGVAYILFNDGHIYRVSTSTAACVATPFAVDQLGFLTFGMGFSTNMGGPAETLFIAGDMNNALGTIDTTSFNLSRVGAFNPTINLAELTGTGDGRLFAFYSSDNAQAHSFVGELDKTTANVIASDPVDIALGDGWAFGFWGGDFYLFTAPIGGTSSDVTRFRPSDKSLTVVGSYPATIVGAGVSTCAPQ